MVKHYQLLWTDSSLSITGPASKEIQQLLTYTAKSLVPNPQRPWERQTKKTRERIFERTDNPDKTVTYLTFQGMLDMVILEILKFGGTFKVYDNRHKFPAPQLDKMHGFRFSQKELLTSALVQERSGLVVAPTRFGKCLGQGTPVLMYDGTIKEVQDIQNGELVMGPDSKPRTVEGVTMGREEMFKISPNYGGMSWTCNASHILHLIRTNDGSKLAGSTIDITVQDYLEKSNTFKHIHKLLRVQVNFKEQELFMDPYVYGAWLGDGHSTGAIFTIGDKDKTIAAYLKDWADKAGLPHCREKKIQGATTYHFAMAEGTGVVKRGTNPIRQYLRSRPKSEGIRKEFLINSRENRLQLLAGLIDTDGYLNNGTCLEIRTKHEQLAKDIVFLCQSLGLGAEYSSSYKTCQTGGGGIYHRVKIRGEQDVIPLKLARKRCVRKNKFNALTPGFEIESIGEGDYYGFTLKEDPLFLLGDCTVCHNTALICNTINAYPGLKTVVVAPGIDLLPQLEDSIRFFCPGREVKGLYTGSRNRIQSEDITVCSVDSMDKLDITGTRLVLPDEPHAIATGPRSACLAAFTNARIIGFGATVSGRWEGNDIMITGLFGPKLAERTYTEAVAEGAICPIKVIFIKVPFRHFNVSTRKTAYDNLYKSKPYLQTLNRLSKDVIPQDWQTLFFISNEKQGRLVMDQLDDQAILAMDKVMKAEGIKRSEMFERLKSGDITRCVCSNIYSTGVTIDGVRCAVNCAEGGGNILSIQKPGRLAEVKEGKVAGYMFDFLFYPTNTPEQLAAISERHKLWRLPVGDCWDRINSYRSKGYEVQIVESLDEIKLL